MKDSDATRDAENLVSFRDPEVRRIFGEQWRHPANLDMAGMTKREEEEFLRLHGPRKERKPPTKRRKAEIQAEKHADNTKKRLFGR